MNFAFDIPTLYDYAFSQDEKLEPAMFLDKEKIRQFQTVLANEIHGNGERIYAYVYIDDEFPTYEEYLAMREDYIVDFGDCYIIQRQLPAYTAQKIEEKYDDEIVIRALRKARASIRTPKIFNNDNEINNELINIEPPIDEKLSLCKSLIEEIYNNVVSAS